MKKPREPNHSIRVIAGKHRGRKVSVHDQPGLRPTPNRVRETLFNWLQFEIAGATILDAFSGTGVMGLEALSRGADSVLFTDNNPELIEEIRATLLSWRETHARVQVCDVLDLRPMAYAYDMIFLDPPFALELQQAAVDKFASAAWLKPYGKIFVEMPFKHADITLPQGFTWHKTAKAGSVYYGLITREDI